MKKTLPIAIACLTLAACAGTTETPALQQAQAEFQNVSGNPEVASNATAELRAAETTLRQAEQSAADGESEEIVNHQAYLAQRRTEIAQETAEWRQAQASVEGADAARAKALLLNRDQQIQALEEELNAKQTPRGLVVTLGGVLFQTGRADLQPSAQAGIDRLAQALQQNPQQQVLIEGHTDNVGNPDSNMRLSEQRADAVRNALIQRGVSPQQISTTGFGETRPVANNDSAYGRQENRRVEVVLSDTEAGNVATR